MKKICATLIVVLMPVLCLAGMESHPGYFSLESTGLLAIDDIEVEINLSGSLLALITGVTAESDPEFSELSSQLEGIRVIVGTPQIKDFEMLCREFDDVGSRLESYGWTRVVMVRENDERVLIFTKDNGDQIDGITVLALDDTDEIVVVNIVGTIDPRGLARLLSSLDNFGDINFDIDSDDYDADSDD